MAIAAPEFLSAANAVLQLRGERANLIAANIANADTPGYKAKDINFASAYQHALETGDVSVQPKYLADFPVGLNGNDVSLTGQKIEAIENTGAMTAQVTFLHQSTSDLITALHPNPNGN